MFSCCAKGYKVIALAPFSNLQSEEQHFSSSIASAVGSSGDGNKANRGVVTDRQASALGMASGGGRS